MTQRWRARSHGGPARGSSVDVLLRVYANCIDGDEEIANERISGSLG